MYNIMYTYICTYYVIRSPQVNFENNLPLLPPFLLIRKLMLEGAASKVMQLVHTSPESRPDFVFLQSPGPFPHTILPLG